MPGVLYAIHVAQKLNLQHQEGTSATEGPKQEEALFFPVTIPRHQRKIWDNSTNSRLQMNKNCTNWDWREEEEYEG